MKTLLWNGVCGLVFSLILTPICRDIFRSYRLVDLPADTRKLHKLPIPRVGGLAIAISYALSYLVSWNQVAEGGPLVWRLLPAVVVVFAIGLIDDLMGLKPWQKLLGQTVAAVLAYYAGVRILNTVGLTWGNYWAFPITVFWLLLCTNAFNLVDGMDGLAAGVGLFATLTIFVSAVIEHNQPLALATFPLAACLLGFLCYNFSPATIFLGDSGSLLVGFLLGCYGAIWSQKSATALGMIAPVMVMGVPLLDVSLSVVRRFLRRRPIFGADRGHIHHRLLEMGFRPRQAVLLIYAGCVLAAGFSLLYRLLQRPELSIVLLLLFAAGLWIGVRHLNYAEFRLARRLLVGGEFQEILNARLVLQELDRRLDTAATPQECWEVLRVAARELGFESLRLSLFGLVRQETREGLPSGPRWTVAVPLSGSDFIELTAGIPATTSAYVLSPLLDLLHTKLTAKLHGPEDAAERDSARTFR